MKNIKKYAEDIEKYVEDMGKYVGFMHKLKPLKDTSLKYLTVEEKEYTNLKMYTSLDIGPQNL